MSIEQRARVLSNELGISQAELQERSGISKQVWSNAFRGKQRMNSDHIEFLCKAFPSYAMWLVTGNAGFGGLEPKYAAVLSEFEKYAEKYAYTISMLEFMSAVSEFGKKSSAGEDELGQGIATPLPSDIERIRLDVLDELLAQDFPVFLKSGTKLDSNLHYPVSEFFREKANKRLIELDLKYGSESNDYIMLSRLLTEFLIPGSTTNIFKNIQ